MAKKNSENVIALEIEKYERKINEFQTYLELNSIIDMIGSDERFKEIDLQKKMMDGLPTWLTALKALKEANEDKVELRGNAEVSPAMRMLMERDKQ